MCDCFPKTGGNYPLPEHCQEKTGSSEYAGNFKQWCDPKVSKNFAPEPPESANNVWNPRYSFSKGPRFGVPPYCDCTPPPERFRFESTYNHDFTDCVHKDTSTQRHRMVEGIRPQYGSFLPKQFLCPFTTESTYSRAFDMPQAHFKQICSQNGACGGCNDPPCVDEGCQTPGGIEIRYSNSKASTSNPSRPRLQKEFLIKPGTDTSDCCRCPKDIPCCPCPDSSKLCEACCGCEFPCKLHQATTTPARKYPIVWNAPRYVPDPREPQRRSQLLCGGGTRDCPIQSQFPTKQAIKQAKYRLMDQLERERCRYPPECIESIYRASFKTPPLNDAPKYCSKEQADEAKKIDTEIAARGLPPKCIPMYCLDGGRPPDPRPAFDHFSTYEADFIWDKTPRYKPLGGEIPGKFQIKPLCHPMVHASEVVNGLRTEEKERWGEDWEYCPPP